MASITVRHNFEAAHRLWLTKGKCEAIHGHSFWVDLTLYGEINSNGIMEGLDFGAVKKEFRSYLDSAFDHRCILNQDDPWTAVMGIESDRDQIPGLKTIAGDPTTENLGMLIAHYIGPIYGLVTEVKVNETSVNAATIWWSPDEDIEYTEEGEDIVAETP